MQKQTVYVLHVGMFDLGQDLFEPNIVYPISAVACWKLYLLIDLLHGNRIHPTNKLILDEFGIHLITVEAADVRDC